MLFNGKSVSEIRKEDLAALVSDKEPELRTLEYKLRLPGSTDEDKREFLADVSSFANTSGGFIAYGIQEEQGRAVDLPGCVGDADAEQLRLQSSIRDGIEPRIPGVDICVVPLADEHWILILHIPRSLSGPHMVVYKKASRFYARTSNGKYQLDVHEIRSAFSFSRDLAVRLRDLRLDRLARIGSGESPVPLPNEPKVVVHIIPMEALQEETAIDIKSLPSNARWRELSTGFASDMRYNVDGLVGYHQAYGADQHTEASHYVQVFRSGIVEAVDAYALRADRESWIPYVSLEDRFVPLCWRALSLQQNLDIDPPIAIFWSMMGVRGYRMPPGEAIPWHVTSEPIDRDTLLLPEVWLEEYPGDLVTLIDALRVPLDALWNAAGFREWLAYDECRRRLVG